MKLLAKLGVAIRALRHAVIARRISYGTRTTEGSLAYCSLLSVIETCRLRKVDPWSYIAQVIALGRKGILPPPIPLAFQVAQTSEGTKAWDIFMSLVATTRKLGISFFEDMQDRISQKSNIPSLGTIIRYKCFPQHQALSCQEELLCMSG
jgi:hypothetical protein